MKAYRFFAIINAVLFVIFILNIVLLINKIQPPWPVRGKVETGKPVYFVDTPDYWSDIADCVACDGVLYVLFDSKSVLACFDLDGNYLHSYALKQSNNGMANLYVDGDTLYLESRGHSFYTFNGGEFTEFSAPDMQQVSRIRKELKESTAQSGQQYKLRGTSVWKDDGVTSQEVIHRPGWLIVFQGGYQILIHIIYIAWLGVKTAYLKR